MPVTREVPEGKKPAYVMPWPQWSLDKVYRSGYHGDEWDGDGWRLPEYIHECGHLCQHNKGNQIRGVRHSYSGGPSDGQTHEHGCCRCRLVEQWFGVSLGKKFPRHGNDEDKLLDPISGGLWPCDVTRYRYDWQKLFPALVGWERPVDKENYWYIDKWQIGIRSVPHQVEDSTPLHRIKNGTFSSIRTYPRPLPTTMDEALVWESSRLGVDYARPVKYERTFPIKYGTSNYRDFQKVIQPDPELDEGGVWQELYPKDEWKKHHVPFKPAHHLGWHAGLKRHVLQKGGYYSWSKRNTVRGADMLGIITGPSKKFISDRYMCAYCRNVLKALPSWLFWTARGYSEEAAKYMDGEEKYYLNEAKEKFPKDVYKVGYGTIAPFVGCNEASLLPFRLNVEVNA